MKATIVKWGNSQGIRLPKSLLETANLSENDTVELTTENNTIIIKKTHSHKTLKDRLEGFDGEYKFEEWDTGEPVGSEVWT